jgi:HSP20 family protein
MTLMRRIENDFLPGFNSFMEDFWGKDFTMNPQNKVAVNVKEDENAFSLEVAAPGMKRDQLKVEVKDNMLTISAQDKQESEEKDEKGTYTRREFRTYSFNRSFSLPENVDGSNINARHEDGILYIEIPKTELKQAEEVKLIDIQ